MKKKYRTRHFLAALLTLILGTGEIAGTGFSVLAADEETEMAEEAGAVEETEAVDETGTDEDTEAVEEDGTADETEVLEETDEPGDEEVPEEEPDAADIPVEKTLENTMLGTWDMASPVVPASDQDPWKGSFVYYGKYEGKVLKYRVLDRGGCDFTPDWQPAMLLDCHQTHVVGGGYYSTNEFMSSTLREHLNGEYFLENDVFTSPEKSAIVNSTKITPNERDGKSESEYGFGKLKDTKIFVLDVKEATNPSYGYFDTIEYSKTREKEKWPSNFISYQAWLLRSPHATDKNYASYVSDGKIRKVEVNAGTAVSPAFNLDLSNIIFATAISGKKGAVNTEYKLTVKNLDMGVDLGTYGKVYNANMEDRILTVPYRITGKDAAEADAVSILILDKEYKNGNSNGAKILYYGTLDCGDSFEVQGRGTFRLPGEFDLSGWGKDYHVYMMAEDHNGSKESDYASRPEEITKDLYQVKEYYSMTFDFQGHGYSDSPMYGPWRYELGEKPYEPLDPHEEGWVFKGWYTSPTDHSAAARFDFSQQVTASVALYAWWVKEWTVTFHYNNGSSSDVFYTNTAEQGGSITLPTDVPQRSGYQFLGWSAEKDSYRPIPTVVNGNKDIYAIWEDVNNYAVRFDPNGIAVKEELQTIYVVAGNKVSEPGAPNATDGWEFLGWYKDSGCTAGNEFDFENETIKGEITLYAKWSDKLKLWVNGVQVESSNLDNGFFSYDIAKHELTLKDISLNKTDVEPPAYTIPAGAIKPYAAYIYADNMDITVKGKARMPEDAEENSNVAGILVGGTVTLDGDFAFYNAGAAVYAVNVIINGGNIRSRSAVIDEDAVDNRTKHPFGIYAYRAIEINGGKVDIELTDALEGYALGAQLGNIDINGGDVKLKVQEYTNSKLVYTRRGNVNNSLSILAPAGSGFDESRQCFVDAYGEEAAEIVLGNAENPWCTVSFDVNGMNVYAPEAQTVKRGTKAKVPAAPNAAGFEFLGWYTGADCKAEERFSFDTPITEDITLYAKWEHSSDADPEEHPELLLSSQSPLDPVPAISLTTTDLYLVKGQKFIIPDCWVIKRDDKASKKVISISKKGQFKAKKTGEAQIWYGDRCVNVHVCQPKVTKSLKPEAGQSETISVSGITDPVAMPILFYCSDPDVAEVNQYGVVHAFAKGSVVITAYINGSAYKCKVTVTENNGTVKERTLHMTSGSTKPIKVKVNGVKKLEWESMDPEIAELNAAKTKVTAKKPGIAPLVAKISDDPMDNYAIYVISEDISLYGNYLEGKNNKYTMKMNTGDKKYSLLNMEYLQHPVVFKSNKPDIAFMDEYGNVVARRKGKAKFTSKVNGKTITINVTVE